MIYPASIKSYRYQNGSEFFFSASDGSVLVMDGPFVLKSFSYCLLRLNGQENSASIKFLDGETELFKTGLANRLGYYSSYGSVIIPGVGMRINESLKVEIDDSDASGSAQCHNLNIGYQR